MNSKRLSVESHVRSAFGVKLPRSKTSVASSASALGLSELILKTFEAVPSMDVEDTKKLFACKLSK